MAIDTSSARKKIEAIDDLPTLPTVASQIVSIANNPKASATDVGDLVSRDQALTGKVLKLVNSSFYGFPQQIKTINHAIVILGFNKVKNVVLTASVFDLTKGCDNQGLDIRRFWEHSLGTAIGSQVTVETLGLSVAPDDAFVAGLLHDFGKVILDQFLTEEYTPVLEMAREKNCVVREMEREVLGFDHQQVGSWIAEKWKLPAVLLHPLRHHNTPSRARDEREMVVAVHLGDIIARAIGVGNSGDPSIPLIDETVQGNHNIRKAFWDKSVTRLIEELTRANDFFDLIEA